MSIANILLSMMVGPTVPGPVPPSVFEAIESIGVTHRDEGRSGC